MIEKTLIEEAKKKLIAQDKNGVIEITTRILRAGEDPLILMNEAFIPAINEVGNLFGRGQLFLPELMQAADAMKAVTDLVNEKLEGEKASIKGGGSILIATVKGDVHDIGKCIVVSLLRANGFTVYDLGRDVETDRIIEEAVKVNADIIGTSALLTTTMPRQKELEEALKSAGLRDRFITIVGGAPVTPRWAARIGADGYAEDAQDGVLKVRALLKKE
jgi:trimethylamine corrinoid protein